MALDLETSRSHDLGEKVSHPLSRRGFMNWAIVVVLVVGVLFALFAWLFPLGSAESNTDIITYQVRKGDLRVTVVEQGTLESSENTEIKCQVRGQNTITWVIESGSIVEKGEELLRLDTLALEEAITERRKFALLTEASALRLKGQVKSAELAVKEYSKGTFVAELMQLEKDLVVAKSNLKVAENGLKHQERLTRRGLGNPQLVRELRIGVLEYEQRVKKLVENIDLLEEFTKKKEETDLIGELEATKANFRAEDLRMKTDQARLQRAESELQHCVVTAPRSGLVIHPSAAQWEGAPDIEEGATVHKTQIMLLMPNLDKMQVKVGIHESVVDRVKPGMKAIVVLNDRKLDSTVQSVASITRPAGWWTGNVVKYDTIIKLPENEPKLKPGMSAEVQVILADYQDVITVPVAAVLQTELGDFCWVNKNNQIKKRILKLGDSNDVFVHVKSGVDEGDEVILNPLDHIDEAEREALFPSKSEDEEEQNSGTGKQNKSTGT